MGTQNKNPKEKNNQMHHGHAWKRNPFCFDP